MLSSQQIAGTILLFGAVFGVPALFLVIDIIKATQPKRKQASPKEHRLKRKRGRDHPEDNKDGAHDSGEKH